jgi:hypothetical protein
MAKAKRDRRTSIRTMPAEGDALSALEAIEKAERERQRLAAAERQGEAEAPERPPAEERAGD